MKPSDWSGAVGEAWAREWRRTDRLFAAVDAALIDAATDLVPPDSGLRILDIGCGAGSTSLALAARLPAPRITGIDVSPAQIATATARAAEIGLIEGAPEVAPALDTAAAGANGWCAFLVADAGRWAGSESFDLIVARHGLMFFDDPANAFAHIRSLAAPGAPLAFSCFRDPALNPWAAEQRALLDGLFDRPPADPHAPGPFAFADRDRVAGLLALAGFADAHAAPLDYRFVAGEGRDPLADALGFFSRIGPAAEALRDAPEQEHARVREGIAAMCERYKDGDRIVFPASAWIWTARA